MQMIANEDAEALPVFGEGRGISRLQLLAADLGVDQHVLFPGAVLYTEMPCYLHLADVGISYVPQTSWFEEQPPLKVIEYMASGLPVIATNTVGHRSIIVHGESGHLVEDDPEPIATAMIELAQNRNMAIKMGRHAQEHAKVYDWQSLFRRRLLPSYEELVKSQ